MSCNSACEEPCMTKKKRSLPGHPDPDSEVIALSPRSLLATNRFVCEICHKGFQREQNLQLHRRGHNLPWRLKQKASNEVTRKKVYICPEPTCAHHEPARALGDLTGIKKHFSRKHGEKKWKCDKCSKRYAVQSDWKAHQKTCGTREYRCDCGNLFSRRDSFITHRAFCDALAEENMRASSQTPQAQDNSEQAATHINNYVNGDDIASGMRAPSSPSSQLSRDVLDTYSGMPNPSMVPSSQGSEFGCQQEGVSMANLYPRGMQAHAPMSISTKTPGLSLCLGMQPGPGPPGELQNRMAKSTLSVGTPPSFLSSTSSNSMHNLAQDVSDIFQCSDSTIHATAASIGTTGMLSTFFPSPEKRFSRLDGAGNNNSMHNILGYMGLINSELDQPPPQTPPFVFSTSRNANKPLNNTPLSYPCSPSVSATALLQKAAQMGSTTSKPFWLQKLGGVEVGEATLEVQNQVKWTGLNTMFSSSIPGEEAAERKPPETENCHGYMEPGYGSIQERMKSGRSRSLVDAWSDMPSSGTSMYCTAARKQPSSQGPGSKPYSSLQGPSMGETSEDASAMVDFLGVEGSARSDARPHWPH